MKFDTAFFIAYCLALLLNSFGIITEDKFTHVCGRLAFIILAILVWVDHSTGMTIP